MKVRVSMLAMSLALGAAMAQDAPKQQAAQPQQPQQQETKAGTPATTMPPEMKTMTYKGQLVDMSCAKSENCAVKSDSVQLGMKLNDGRVFPFDMVGNQRAQDELKSNKRWSKDLSANKPIKATVNGVVSGEKLVVSQIH
jgi:hypothetical protein